MLEAITTGVTTAVGSIGTVVSAIFGATGELKDLLPVIGLAIGMGVVGFAVSKIKSLTWGF